jgi:hypothetical protein
VERRRPKVKRLPVGSRLYDCAASKKRGELLAL